ncbi:MAG: S1 RNA-binding domain-containing protein, partial [Pseudomonadota bacterium]
TFAEWEVDYVKLDWCGNVKHQPWKGPKYHREFGQAMLDAARPMYLETVAGYFFLGKEISDYANAWRFCEDHHDEWESTLENMLCRGDQHATAVTAGEPGAWPYMDFLMTGGQGCAPYVEVQVGDDGATGFIKRSDLGRDRDEQRPDRFQVGAKVDAMVTGFDRSKKPNFSIKARQIAEEKEAVAQFGSSDSGASLGDILGEALKKSDD